MADSILSTEPSVSAEQYYAIIRRQIEHEDDLVSQRLSWLVAAQAFLFTAYAIVISNISSGHQEWVTRQMHRLLVLIPVAAVLTCILIYVTILAGLMAIRNLHRLYDSFFSSAKEHGLPPVQGYRRTQLLGQAAPLFVPLVFLAVWLILLTRG